MEKYSETVTRIEEEDRRGKKENGKIQRDSDKDRGRGYEGKGDREIKNSTDELATNCYKLLQIQTSINSGLRT